MGHLCFSLSLILVLILAFSSKGESKTYWGDIEGLKSLKKGITASSITPGSCLSSWDFSVDPCDNLYSSKFSCGFRCDGIVIAGFKRVTEISFDRAGYTGSLSSSTFTFPYLETLDFTDNSFTGVIPNSLSNLVRLRKLYLSGNSFSGYIPNSIGSSLTQLEELYLDNNHLQGSIPANFNNLVSLKRLGLHQNKLNGGIPNLGSLKNLVFIDLSNNLISGKIPENLPTTLVQILIRNNYLSGNLPVTLKNLGYLQVIDLSHNLLSGTVSVFDHPSLQQVTLSHNKFQSLQEPRNLIRSELLALDISYNDLHGELPVFMAKMKKISALSLEKNKLTGLIHPQYGIKTASPEIGVSPFVRLLLGGNYLHGPDSRPLIGLKPGSAVVSLIDNCFYRCPTKLFFCRGGVQKSLIDCNKNLSP
ncbi:hypothetical protein MKW92_027343 [Papaver armeniacum]|nr:hypothetical protein MKW92_027343 [Papaver armeniacum]